MYKVDAMVIGGDLAGKSLVPIIDIGGGKYKIMDEIVGREVLEEYIKMFKAQGTYYTITDERGYNEIAEDKKVLDKIFLKAMVERLEEWVRLAEERLKDSGIKIYTILGNDDPK